jgi:hypothetical protein
MEAIRDFIEWIGNDSGSALATIFPYLLVGLAALWLLWLVVGYLRVSQVGLADDHAIGTAAQLSGGTDEEQTSIPRGVPYCAVDRLEFPAGARFCTTCERDLSLDCTNCGATLRAGEASCYRCGTPTGAAKAALLS